jgi:hypothetical protein
MKFDKAYCVELEDEISPYIARELYFNSDSSFFGVKLNFNCPSRDCEAKLIPVCVYRADKIKTKLHFRSLKIECHAATCDYEIFSNYSNTLCKEAINSNRIKNGFLPTEFLLEKPNINKYSNRKNSKDFLKIDENPEIRTKSKKYQKYGDSPSKTPYLEQIVDCFENISKDKLKQAFLTIGPKKKRFYYCFKFSNYYYEEEGLIYYGPLKRVKKYGENYSIRFQYLSNPPEFTSHGLEMRIYLKKELIENYNKKKKFIEILDMLSGYDGEIICYYTGVRPVKDKYILPKNNQEIEYLKLEIENLDHLVFRFDRQEID